MSEVRLEPVFYRLSSKDVPAVDDWRIQRFRMHEAISEPYQITLEVASEEHDIEVDELLGASVEIALTRGTAPETSVMGVVAGIDWLGVSLDRHTRLRLDIRPAFALLEQRVHSRLWQDASPIQIIEEILGELSEYGREVATSDVARGRDLRSYCVQFRESDFAFVCRLLEEEGIGYYFAHDEGAGHEILTLFDNNKALPWAANVDASPQFPVIIHNPDEVEVESVQAVEWRRRLRSTGALRRDFDWMMPTNLLSSEVGEPDERGRTRRVYVHGHRQLETDDGATRAQDLVAAEAVAGMRGHGRGNATGFRAGHVIDIEGHDLIELDDELVLVRVEHEGENVWNGSSLEGVGYRNYFECVPRTKDLRPAQRTPKPRVHGPQTAIVCGSEGEEIDVDKHGRIRVQFYWQEDPTYDVRSSCWVRVAQSWAGPGWGAQFIPRIGMEVVVEFLEGNPDRPLVTGCVYNGDNPPPFALPGDKTQSGIRTSSSPGGGGSNELRFEDSAGAEEIYLHAQKDWTIETLHDKNQSVGNDESHSVGHDRSKTVGHDETISVGNDQTISVGKDETETVGNNLTLTVAKDQRVTIGNNQTVTIASNRAETIGASATETVAITKVVTVGAAMQVSVGAALNQSVGAASAEEVGAIKSVTVGADHKDEAGGSRTIEAGKDFIVKAAKKGTLQTGEALGIMTSDKLSMNADKDMMIGSNAKGMFEFKDELRLKCGKAQIVLAKSGDVTITGATITVKGSKNVVVKGSKVQSN
ncbi:type VI secretion system tip protein VgrG [Pseudenhygromyxa sp. WMMC2535]|uniref:type VI secretion system Vgr family protein n=1 Tax=Pseudenhygromyxa sp. WMMC2535 TaxID=2712867 RepID=UPI001551CDBC|nr:type VI secretion system tip protein TssI/VgrG [Pseudenhygromyxa sp. WMMC2535]NVB41973.1 type VI secretion system tip protein VgrG [Pseudenhygromyxa sp. WMMC2535]